MNELVKVELDDILTLQKIGMETFADTFGTADNQANLAQYFQENYNVDQIAQELANPESQFQFLYHKGHLAGYMKVNVGQAQSEFQQENGLEIQRLYIKKEYKRLGLGSQLINNAIEQGKQLNKDYVWLGVWEHNAKAIRFYEKMNFHAFSEHDFTFGEEIQRDILVRRELV
ncbi:GNAT family N-acetyltransferase [Convivina intestini]|uniref:Ribosomal protein S18 acetylase RimI-like enzyme n=1 Tax=Convivina intestini TaxID=1505726 RepID=A0A2U1D658_9LACO|nr:GNAT family N-acetyltransferase [Convivina intestini]PVY83079.1 ribosomal protein S18 acetylase RimI-like enzyme [Convivina intestini]CAH1856565.1 Spermidine/spermine N(1)-acetyltransferase [Convivina intestini]SDB98354.1 Ribosomal protein S18 acetylase RimI [Leuconostocaceae bacterium R-53105]